MGLASDAVEGIIDSTTPTGTLLAGKYKKTFAYVTFNQRIPKILNTIIAAIQRDKTQLIQENGESAETELLEVVDKIHELNRDIETNKRLEPLTGNEPDILLWNNFLDQLPDDKRTYYHACWLYAECYMYRKIYSFFKSTSTLINYDYFGDQKEHGMIISEDIIQAILQNTRDTPTNKETLTKLLKVNLWGNRCDLSISSGKEVKPDSNPLDNLEDLDMKLLINNCDQIWNVLNTVSPIKKEVVEIVCDNAGFEFFTDLILAEYMIDKGLAEKVRFNVKAIPWYISDVTPRDFYWAIRYLQNHEKSELMRQFGTKVNKYVMEGKFELAPEQHFWTLPHEYYRMESTNLELYRRLSEAKLVIFKGDLNYRKLLGDYNWDYSEDFITCLRGFRPTNLCSLRTVKADLICGISKLKLKELFTNYPDWMTTGEFGIIQFAPREKTALDEI